MQLKGLRQAHRRLLLTLLQHGPMLRHELGRRMELSAASITRLTKPLEAQGLVEVTTEQLNTMGRPTHRIAAVLPPEGLVGVSITAEALIAVRTDLRGRVTAERTVPLDTCDPDAVADQIATLVQEVSDVTPVGVGLGVGGIVRNRRWVLRAPFLGWDRVNLAGLVESRLGGGCVVSNDIAAVALAEAWFGVGMSAESFLVHTFGFGVGGASVVRGVVQDAEAHGVGLLGHLPVRWPSGETVRANDSLNDGSLLARARTLGSKARTADEVEAGIDEAARRASADFAYAAGMLTATGAAFLVPEAVVILGERAGLISGHRADFNQGMASVRETVAPPLAITVREHTRTVWARGAAVVALISSVTGG